MKIYRKNSEFVFRNFLLLLHFSTQCILNLLLQKKYSQMNKLIFTQILIRILRDANLYFKFYSLIIFCYLQPLLTSAHLQPPNSQWLFQGRPCIFQQDIPIIAAITKAEKFDISKLLHLFHILHSIWHLFWNWGSMVVVKTVADFTQCDCVS